MYQSSVNRIGETSTNKTTAKAGYSELQTGLAAAILGADTTTDSISVLRNLMNISGSKKMRISMVLFYVIQKTKTLLLVIPTCLGIIVTLEKRQLSRFTKLEKTQHLKNSLA